MTGTRRAYRRTRQDDWHTLTAGNCTAWACCWLSGVAVVVLVVDDGRLPLSVSLLTVCVVRVLSAETKQLTLASRDGRCDCQTRMVDA